MNEKKGDQPEVMEDLETKEETKEHKLWTPRIITGGKSGPPGKDWLLNLDKGIIFLARPKDHKGFELTQYRLVFKFIKTCLVRVYLPDKEFSFYVESTLFSRDMELVEIIGQEEDE